MTKNTNKKWTETYIKNLPIEDKRYSRSEDGLRLRVSPTGKKVWSYYKTDLSGEREHIPLGEFPAVSLAQARQMATVNEANIYTKGHGLLDTTKGITFKDFIESEAYQSTGRLRPSHDSIMDNLRSIVPPKIQSKPLKLITPTHIENFIEGRLKAGKKKGTINKNITNIRSVFRVALDKNIIDENIMKKVKSLKDDTATEKLALTEDERKRLIKTAEDMSLPQADKRKHMPVWIHLGLDTGLRSAELTSLKWSDIRNDSIRTIDVVGQTMKYQFQTPNIVIAEHEEDESILDEKQLTKLYDADERTLTVYRLYPSIDQTDQDHKNIKALIKRLAKDGYVLKIDKRRNWYVHVRADAAKGRKARSVGIKYKTIQKLFKYMRELYKPTLEYKKQWHFDGFDHYLNPLYSEFGKDPQTEYEAGRPPPKTLTQIGWMKDKPLFPSKEDPKKSILKVKKSFGTICKNAGLDITPHILRHEFCTDLIRRSVAVTTVQRLAGHADINTTMKYVHYVDSKDFSALDLADKK